MNSWLLFVASVALTVIAFPCAGALSSLLGMNRANFRGDVIPSGFGILFVIVAVPIYAVMLRSGGDHRIWSFLAAMVGFGLIGLLDDVYGSRDVGGFRGHIGLLRQGKLSTGLMKMFAGGIIAMALGFVAAGGQPLQGIVNALVIALTANLLNLLDLRPGRALFCYWLGFLILVMVKVGKLDLWQAVIPVLAPVGFLTWLDRSAKAMLGDTGSNALGAVLGLLIVYEAILPVKVILVLLIVAVHIYSETHSITALIEGNSLLRKLDRVLGER